MNNKSIAKNISYSLISQVISLAVSFLLNLIVPRFISEYNYAYWQSYVLYIGYVGILHFGIIDGLVLRYSQFDYDEINHQSVRSQFYLLIIIDIVFCFSIILFLRNIIKGVAGKIMVFVAVGIVTKNIATYSYYLLQITNRIKKYALIIILNRVAYGLIVVCLLVLKVDDYVFICIADLFCDLITICYAFSCSKALYIGKALPFRDTLKETSESIKAGIFVLVANWSSNLIIGSGKMIVQWHWDNLLFGKLSFAFSLSNIFLSFVTAISVVLFPSIKRMDVGLLPGLYKRIRDAISPILFSVLIFYFPGCLILDLWLPKYHNSLGYLGILLPMIIFTTKVNLLTNNYLKAYRKEKNLLSINLGCVVIGVILYLISALLFDSIVCLLVSVVFVLITRSIISEIVIMKIIKINLTKEFLIELLMTGVFIFCAILKEQLLGFLFYFSALIVYFILNKKSISATIGMIRKSR